MGKSLLSLAKRIIWSELLRLKSLKKPSISYCVNNALLPSIITGLSGHILREMFNLSPFQYQTQLNQDIFALLMNRFQPGYFLEIGANDGFTFSNTVYLEEKYGWKGALVEANPKYAGSLSKRKNSVIVNKAVSTQNGKAIFVDAGLYGGLEVCLDKEHNSYTDNANRITVECMNLQEILDQISTPSIIDFISIDVEGGEVPIVEQMVSVNRRFRCGCCEYNGRQNDYDKIARLLESAGYKILWEGQTMQDLFFIDNKIQPRAL